MHDEHYDTSMISRRVELICQRHTNVSRQPKSAIGWARLYFDWV